MTKINVEDYTKAGLADYALANFGVTINRKNSRPQVVKKFKKAEKDHIADMKSQEESKAAETKQRQKNADRVAEKQEAKNDEKVDYPVEMKNEEGDIRMHRPCKGGLALGDPINRKANEDGEVKTDSTKS